MVVSAFCFSNNTWDNQFIKREGLFYLVVIELSVQDQLAHCYWACDEQNNMAAAESKAKSVYIMTRIEVKKREKTMVPQF
jgi:tRNA(Leu) C34 or U34 (ribose-2'-O)-methylase TrmL